MKRTKGKFGLLSIILLGVNAIIGSGIFLLPGSTFAAAGTSSLFIYIAVAVMAMLIAFCFAEVGGMFNQNGGAYVYVKEAYGDFAGFEVGVMKWVVQLIAQAAMAAGFATAVSSVWPAAEKGLVHNLIVIVLVGGLAIINILGVDPAKHVNNIASLGKLIPLILFIVVGIFFIKGANFQPVAPKGLGVSGISTAVLLIFYAFTGFESIATAAEDMDNPKRNLPISIVFTMILVSIVYFLIQFVCIGTAAPELAKSSTPIATAMGTFFGGAGTWIVTIGTLISIGGINVAASFLTPRGGAALAENGMFPRVMARQSQRGTPYVAIIVSTAIVIPIALSGSFITLAAISVISRFTQYIPTCLSVITFRRRRSDLKTTFRVPGGYVIPVLAVASSVWILVHADLQKILLGLGALVIAVTFYFVMNAYRKKNNGEENSNAKR